MVENFLKFSYIQNKLSNYKWNAEKVKKREKEIVYPERNENWFVIKVLLDSNKYFKTIEHCLQVDEESYFNPKILYSASSTG